MPAPTTQDAYRLLDAGDGQKLEQVGPYRLVRPAAQAVWRPRLGKDTWRDVDAIFERTSATEGQWHLKNKKLPAEWPLQMGPIRFLMRLTDFGHLGIFPEQHANWLRLADLIRGKRAQVLNLFAYTGGSTLAAAAAGAQVVHLDASKTSVAWARENAAASGLAEAPIRWIVDDVQKFVARELRRGSHYQGIILDPPSYGRGSTGQVWKIEEDLPKLLDSLRGLMAPDFSFLLLSCHTAGFTPIVLKNLIAAIVPPGSGLFEPSEMILPEADGVQLPSGASCLYARTP